jgi:Bifunctional DNA primase/polymerase, N-terminal/Protein of unknown function (DUF3987)
MIDCLKIYTSMGWAVFPCFSHEPDPDAKKKLAKSPLIAGGHNSASLDIKQIEEWLKKFPNCAWGVRTSAEHGVMDIDPRNGGNETLAALEAEYGPLPLTPKVRTGGNGFHYWLKFPAGTGCGKPFPGIDRKAEGGYVIVPPSRIAIPEHCGKAYAWELRPWEESIAEAPAWALTTKPKAKASADAFCPLQEPVADDPWIVQAACLDLLSHPGAPEGERRRTICQLVGVHLARGDSAGSIVAMAQAWASRCAPPLEEWRTHVDGLLRREAGKMSEADASADLLPSFPPSAEAEKGEPQAERSGSCPLRGQEPLPEPSPSYDWPTLPPEAVHGLLGEMLKAVEPETEADPAGVLLGWLSCFGSIVGRGAWVYACGNHHPALFLALVGLTSARKGVSYGIAEWPFVKADPEWARLAVCYGVGSGQGLIERVRDESRSIKINKKGEAEEQVIPGAKDKRCLNRLDELAVCFKLQRSESSTLGETLMTAWGGSILEVLNRSGNDLRASDYSIAVIGDTQPETLKKLLEKGVESYNGWLNRFLWCVVKRVRNIPRPAKLEPLLSPFLERLASALAFAKQAGELAMDGEAESLWDSVYDELSISADSVPHTNRAEPYVMRLSMLYALADCSKVIRREHLQAALALWGYCRASAKLIFCGRQTAEAEPDPFWLKLLNAITTSPGISRTGLREVVGTRVPSQEIEDALARLEQSGSAYRLMVKSVGKRSASECWFPGTKPEGEDAEPDAEPDADADAVSVEDDNFSTLSPVPPASPSAETREGRNSLKPLPCSQELSEFLPSRPGEERSQELSEFLPSRPGEERSQELSEFLPSRPGEEQEATCSPDPPESEKEIVIHNAVQPQAKGKAMTLDQFKAEALADLGRWDAPLGGKPNPWKTEADQLRWYMACRKAQAESEAERLKRIGSVVIAEADFLAEWDALPPEAERQERIDSVVITETEADFLAEWEGKISSKEGLLPFF